MFAIPFSEQSLVMHRIPDREYFMVDEEGNVIEPNVINWDEKIDPEEETTKAVLEEMYYPPEERFNGKKQIDVRKLNYSYFWVDYQQAAKSKYIYDYANNTGKYEGQVTNLDGYHVPMLKTVHHSSNMISLIFIPTPFAG